MTKAKWRQCKQEFIAPSLPPALNSRVLKRVKVYIKFRGWQWQKVKQTCSNWTDTAFLDKLPFKCNLYWTNYITEAMTFDKSFRPFMSFLLTMQSITVTVGLDWNTSGTLKNLSQRRTKNQNGHEIERSKKIQTTQKKTKAGWRHLLKIKNNKFGL